MDSILPAFVIALLLLFTVLTPTESYFSSQDRLQTSRQVMEARLLEQARTDVTLTQTQISSDGALVELTLRNTGQTKLADFDQWDLILEYRDAGAAYHIVWLPYDASGSPAPNTWSVASIVQDDFDPGIFNPGEMMTVRLQASPVVGPETVNRVALTTATGLGVSTPFIGPPLPPTPTPPTP